MKPSNWLGLVRKTFIMWLLLTQKEVNWVKFILDQMNICSTPKRSLFYNSIIQFILDSHSICHVSKDMLDAPRVFYSSVVKLMRYYKDKYGLLC